jgi:ribonuclease J
MFASNVQRMGAIANLARKHKRKLVLLGRSMQTHSRVARDQKRLDWPSDLVVSLDEARSMKRRDVLVLATGTQGEKMAALWRLSTREHPAFMLDAGDKVIFSCRVIPGNDPTVVTMTNGFLRQGIQVHTPITNPGVHVSGHAYRDEQRRMIDLVRPTGFVPVHGTLHHLHRHAELAREQGVTDTLVLENGEIGEVAPTAMKKAKDTAKHAKIPTWNGEEIPLSVLSDRETIARAGIAFVTVLVDGQGRPVGPTTVTTRGVIDEKADAEVLRSAARAAHEALTARPGRGPARDDELAEIARLAARKQLELAVGKKPLVLTNVVRVKA